MEIDRIKRFGRLLQWLTMGIILLTPVAILLVLRLKGPLGLVTLPPKIDVDQMVLTFPHSFAIIVVGLLTPATYVLGFAFLYKLFSLYAQGIVFSEKNVIAIRRCGYVLIAVDVVRILQSALTGPVLTMLGAVKGYLSIDLGISMLIVGLAIVLISHVMDMGRKIYERDRLTI